jgi:hypothetical protein
MPKRALWRVATVATVVTRIKLHFPHDTSQLPPTTWRIELDWTKTSTANQAKESLEIPRLSATFWMSLGSSTSPAKAVPRQGNSNDSEIDPLLWTPSSNYGTEDYRTASTNLDETRDPALKRQIGVVSAVFMIFNRVIGTGCDYHLEPHKICKS